MEQITYDTLTTVWGIGLVGGFGLMVVVYLTSLVIGLLASLLRNAL